MRKLTLVSRGQEFTWARWSPTPGLGYEVSSASDDRFSAFHALMSDGRTIEQWYQCDVKGYDPGGTNWRLGKGKPSLLPYVGDSQWQMYLALWRLWIIQNPNMVGVLVKAATPRGRLLTDRYATSEINQAHALSVILNEWSEC